MPPSLSRSPPRTRSQEDIYIDMPPTIHIQEPRGRSMSRSRSRSPTRRYDSESVSSDRDESRSRSRSPRRFSYLRRSPRRARSYTPSRSRSRSYSPPRRLLARALSPEPFVPSPAPPSPIPEPQYPVVMPVPVPTCYSPPPPAVYQPYPFAVCGGVHGIPPPTIISSELHTSTELLTYSLAGKLAYVPAGKTYEEALDHAVTAFPSLASLERSRISLHVAGRDALVRVTGGAWSSVLKDLPKYEIVTVEVEQLVEDAPPQYDTAKATGYSYKVLSLPYKDVRKRKGVFGWLKVLFGKE